jgi:hypothetical protein
MWRSAFSHVLTFAVNWQQPMPVRSKRGDTAHSVQSRATA